MTREDEEMLLADLCARLSYGVKCEVYNRIGVLDEVTTFYGVGVTYSNGQDTTCRIDECKPYLRPMSSMTEEEKKEFIHYAGYEVEESVNGRHYEYYLKDYVGTPETPICNCNSIDWCNKNHFDYRGLIPMGLAIDATNLNIY